MNDDKLVENLISRFSDELEMKNFLMKKVLFFNNKGKLIPQRALMSSNWAIQGSIAEVDMGLKPMFYHISLSKSLSIAEIEKLFGHKMFERTYCGLRPTSEAKRWISWSGEGQLYKIKVGSELPSTLIWNLWKELIKAFPRLQLGDLLPLHPSWGFEPGLGINFLVAKPGTPKFGDLINGSNKRKRVIFRRAGSDIYKTPLFEKKLQLLVTETSEGNYDGDIYIRPSVNEGEGLYLVRSAFKHNNKVMLIKGRAHSVEDIKLPDGSPLPVKYDGWTSLHNIKWGVKGEDTCPKEIEANVKFVSEEHSGTPEVREVKFSSVGLVHLNNGNHWLSGKKKIMYGKFRTNHKRIDRKIEKFPREWESLAELFTEDENSGIRMSQIAKASLGLATPQDLTDIKRGLEGKLRSCSLKGFWVPIIVRDINQKPGVIVSDSDTIDVVYSELTRKKVKEVGVLRYPPTSYQSYMTLRLEPATDVANLPKGVFIIHPEDASYMGADGDDHAMITEAYSKFRGGEPELVTREDYKVLDIKKEDFMDMYFAGSRSKLRTGIVSNALIKALDKGENELALKIGEVLDQVVQSIKKPISIDMSPVREVQLLEDFSSEANVALKRNIETSSREAFKVPGSPPSLKESELPQVKFGEDIKEPTKRVLKEVDKQINLLENLPIYKCNGRKVMNAARAWHSKLFEWVIKSIQSKDMEKIHKALKIYAATGISLKNWANRCPYKERFIHPFIRTLDGEVLIAGVQLAASSKE